MPDQLQQPVRRTGALLLFVTFLITAFCVLAGAGAAGAAPAKRSAHPIPAKTLDKDGAKSLCYDPNGFTCAGGGYNGKSDQIGGNGWSTRQYWDYGSLNADGSRHNCTTYVAYRLQMNGYAFPQWAADAWQWGDKAWAADPRVQVDQTPAVGSIAQWNSDHVAYVEEVTTNYIVTTSDSYGGGTDKFRIERTSKYMPDNFIHFKDLNEGMVVRAGGAHAVVVGGQRQKLGAYQTELCAIYDDKRQVRVISAEEFKSIPDSGRTYGCDLNKTVFRASDKSDPKPSWAYHDQKRYAIQDGQTFQALVNTPGWRLADAPFAEITDGRLADGGKEPVKLYAPNYVGKMLLVDKVDYVVGSDNQRHRVPDYQTMACGLYDRSAPSMSSVISERHVTGLTADQVSSIPLSRTSYSCSLNQRILRASDKPEPKPSWTYHDGRKWAIGDRWTYDYYVRRGYQVVDLPAAVVTNDGIPSGGDEPAKLDAASIAPNSVVTGANRIDYVVDASKQRHRIPFIQDDVCWRDLRGYSVVATGLTDSQLDGMPQRDDYPCIIGPRMVQSDDGSSWYVDSTNTRHRVPDTDTYYQLIRTMSLPVSGSWPAADVNFLPKGPDQPQLVDKEAVKNSIVCRASDRHCWAVDGNAVRHFIPSYGDDVCWRWVNGWHVSRPAMNDAQVISLGESDSWGCNMNNSVIATNEGPAYYMDGNTRRPIVDGYDYNCLVENGARQIRGMSKAEADGLPIASPMPMCSSPSYRIVSIRSNANGKTVSAEFGYGGDDYGMLRARNSGVGGAWETFRLVGDCNSGCGIQSAQTRQFVTAENGYQGYAWGEMRARSGGIGSWETFKLVGDCNTGCAIWANANQRYVSAELDFTGNGLAMLRARSQSVGGWERFTIR